MDNFYIAVAVAVVAAVFLVLAWHFARAEGMSGRPVPAAGAKPGSGEVWVDPRFPADPGFAGGYAQDKHNAHSELYLDPTPSVRGYSTGQRSGSQHSGGDYMFSTMAVSGFHPTNTFFNRSVRGRGADYGSTPGTVAGGICDGAEIGEAIEFERAVC
jgi:hypothetical protein